MMGAVKTFRALGYDFDELPAAKDCPLCGSPGVVNAPRLRRCNTECTRCGWYYASMPRTARDE